MAYRRAYMVVFAFSLALSANCRVDCGDDCDGDGDVECTLTADGLEVAGTQWTGVCFDGIDNDCDGEVDECWHCVETWGGIENCVDGLDNDCDGDVDGDDDDCQATPA